MRREDERIGGDEVCVVRRWWFQETEDQRKHGHGCMKSLLWAECLCLSKIHKFNLNPHAMLFRDEVLKRYLVY